MTTIPRITHSSSTDSFEVPKDMNKNNPEDVNMNNRKRPLEVNDVEEVNDFVEVNDVEETTIDENSISLLQNDGLIYIFGLLTLRELTVLAPVCRHWNVISSDFSLWGISRLKELYPKIEVFGAARRENQKGFFLNVLIPTVKQFANLKILGNAGISVVTLDEASLKKLQQKAKGKGLKFGEIQRSVLTRIGGKEVTGTWVMTNSGLEGTGNLTLSEQRNAVNEFGFDMLELAPTFALCYETYCKTGKNLFGAKPLTYVRLADSIETTLETENLVLGGSTDAKGPNIRSYGNKEKIPHYYSGAMKKI